MTRPQRLWLFGVAPDGMQLTWERMGPGEVTITVGPVTREISTDGGPGAVTIDGLSPDTTYEAVVHGPDAGVPESGLRRSARTLPRPAGAELLRFATFSDLHLGETHFGYLGTMEEKPVPEVRHPERAARAALGEMRDWGAELVVVKGDCTNDARLDEWERFGGLMAESGLRWEGLPGNHDSRPVDRERSTMKELSSLLRGGFVSRLLVRKEPRTGTPVTPLEGFASIGYDMPDPVKVVDVDGLRIVLADTAKGFHIGTYHGLANDVADVAREAASGGRATFVAAHHYPMALSVPHFWPPGVPAREASSFFDQLARASTPSGAARPRAFYTAGHTHRHRRYYRSDVVCTEVGSPKDYPGTWAGYIVYESGITQIVRRVAAPDVLRWTDYSGRAALGAWKLWSPGLRSHRCFHRSWVA